jgi:hypothetical protein
MGKSHQKDCNGHSEKIMLAPKNIPATRERGERCRELEARTPIF